MQKITPKYLLWKVIIHLLLLVMVLPLTFPASLVMKSSVEGLLMNRILSGAGLVVFLFFQNWLIGRSDLSRIKKGSYVLGESLAYAAVVLIGHILLIALSRGIVPAGFSYFFIPFFPALTASFAFNNALIGFFVQIAVYPLCVLLLYAIKKKRNPALTPNKKQPAAVPSSYVADYKEDDRASGEEESGEGAGETPSGNAEASALPEGAREEEDRRD